VQVSGSLSFGSALPAARHGSGSTAGNSAAAPPLRLLLSGSTTARSAVGSPAIDSATSPADTAAHAPAVLAAAFQSGSSDQGTAAAAAMVGLDGLIDEVTVGTLTLPEFLTFRRCVIAKCTSFTLCIHIHASAMLWMLEVFLPQARLCSASPCTLET